MSLDWVYDAILAALPTYGAENIFRAHQGVTIPSDPFITYSMLNADGSRFQSQSDGNPYADPDYTGAPPTPIGTFDRTYQQNYPVQIQVDCYSSLGLEDLSKLVSYLRGVDGIAVLNASHVSFVGAGQMRNMEFLGDTEYLDRWMVVLDFELALTRTEALRAILSWEIAGETDCIDTVIIAE